MPKTILSRNSTTKTFNTDFAFRANKRFWATSGPLCDATKSHDVLSVYEYCVTHDSRETSGVETNGNDCFGVWPQLHITTRSNKVNKKLKFIFFYVKHTNLMQCCIWISMVRFVLVYLRCSEPPKMAIYTDIVIFPKSTKVIRDQWHLMTSCFFRVCVLLVVIWCADFEFGIRFSFMCAEIGSFESWYTPDKNGHFYTYLLLRSTKRVYRGAEKIRIVF